MLVTLSHGGQIDISHIRPLMAQQTGDFKMSVQRALAAARQLLVLLRRIGMAKPMEGHRAVRIHIPHFVPVPHDEELQMVDSPIRGHVIGHQQLMSPWRALQLLPHGNGNLLIDGDSPHFAALALDGDGVLPKRPLCRGGVDAEALVDTQASIPGQVQSKDEVITVIGQRFTQSILLNSVLLQVRSSCPNLRRSSVMPNSSLEGSVYL